MVEEHCVLNMEHIRWRFSYYYYYYFSGKANYILLMILLQTLLSQRRLDRLLPEVVKVMSTSNVELKRLCYLYVGLACQKVLRHPSDWAVQERAVLLLTINAFQKVCDYWCLKF